MKVVAAAAIVVTAVLFIGAKTGWFDARNIQSDDAMAANRIGSSAPSSAQKVSTNSSSDTAPEEPAETKKSDTLTGEAARDQLRKSGQYESLGAAFQAARYAVEKIDPAGLHSRGAEYFASNPKQQLRAWFRDDGIELASGRSAKEENAEPWSVAVRLRASGRKGATIETGPRTVRVEGGRVEMSDPDGAMTEWYENRSDGLEQGFTFTKPPPGAGTLEIVLAAEGNTRPEPLPGAEGGIRFVQSDGKPIVHYTGLKARDAAGRTLPAQMELRGTEMALLVTDAGAQYPVIIDPLFVNVEARLVEDGTAGDHFGWSVALDGDTALIGDIYDSTPAADVAGSAYVFVRNGTSWSRQAKLTASDGADGDNFGWSVALNGDTALVGSLLDTTAVAFQTGSAFVFVRSGLSWTQQAKLTAADGVMGDQFGFSAALSGDIALVGAPFGNNPAGTGGGLAYVFARSGTSWNQQTKLTAGNDNSSFSFGWSVALSKNTALVSSFGGSAFVFIRDSTSWNQQAKLISDAPEGGESGFGGSLALSGETAIVGTSSYPTPEGIRAASAVVFLRNGTTWTQQARLTASDEIGNIGSGVALSGDTAVLKVRLDTPSGRGAVSANVFVRTGTSWTQQVKLIPSDGADGAGSGKSVALSGDIVLLGADSDDTPTGEKSGSAYAFTRSGTNWHQGAKLTANNDPAAGFDSFGNSVALSGNTALIGSPTRDTPEGADAGSAYVFVRSDTRWSQQAQLVASDGKEFGRFGSSVALSTDTALVGADSDETPTGTNAGSAYVFVRNGTNWSQQAKLTASDGAADDRFGNSVALTEDTALIGADSTDTLVGTDAGSAYVFVRSGTNWRQQAKLAGSDGTAWGRFGNSVALYEDTSLVGGGSSDKLGGIGIGSAYVFTRNGTNWSQQSKLNAKDGVVGDGFGKSVALSEDTALVGADAADTPAGDLAGCAYLFVRSGTNWVQQAKLTASDGAARDRFGWSVAVSGDTALVGAFAANTVSGIDAGSAYAFARSGKNWSQQARLTAGIDGSAFSYLGSSVALSGDTALVGSPRVNTAPVGRETGDAYVFLLGKLPNIIAQPTSRTVVPGVSVSFSVTVIGYAPLRYQWRKEGVEISGASGANYSIASSTKADAGKYDVVISNIGGTATSAAAVLQVNDLSAFTQQSPSTVAGADGFIVVNLSGPPTAAGMAWRFVGEQQWRIPGVPVGGLATGSREVEFRPVVGHLHPLREPVSIVSGQAATVVEREYFPDAGVATGTLSVTLLPVSLGGLAQWRLLGDGDSAWRNSGGARSDLAAGVYLVECREVAGYTTPQPRRVTLGSDANPPLTATYFLKDAAVGTQPGAAGFDAITASGPNPYTFVGQFRSDSGAGTGFVVRRRVVATAAHVVFDDGTLSAATGLQWLFQREKATYEPVPQEPRGSYILSGYSAARNPNTTPGVTPGASSLASQNLDVAAVWFYEQDAARGGYGGYLASDAPDNEWLLSERLKTLVGYPLDDVAPANQGRMHATPPANIAFTHANDRVFLTSDITSRGGNSGGPVCVQYDDGNYFPAAIYLGGTTQTRVRAIDSDVIELFDSAEESGNTGKNSTNGGIPQLNSASAAPPSATLTVMIEPREARDAGAGWSLGRSGFLASGQAIPFLSPGNYTISSKPILGFVTPISRTVPLTLNSPPSVITYVLIQVPVITTNSRTLRAIRGRPLPAFTVEATGGPTRFQASGLGGTNLTFDEVSGRLSGTPTTNGTFTISLIAENNLGSSAPVPFTIIVSEPRKLIVRADSARGRVDVKPKRTGNIFPQGEIVTLTAEPDRPGFLFAGWNFDGATPDSQTNATSHFRMGAEAVVVTANFVPNPFLPRSGSYAGLLTNAGVPAGRSVIAIGRTGSFSLGLVIGHAGYSLVGGFDLQGNFTGRIRRPGASRIDVVLHLDLAAAGTPTVTGTITADGVTYDLATTHAGTTLPPAGKFTVTLPPDPTQTDATLYPQGNGFALVRVDATGTVVSAVGRLGDGQSFSVGGQFTDDGRWAIYTQPYGNRKRGLLGGEISFHPATAPGIATLDGRLRWNKPSTTTGLYAAGFGGSIAAEGSSFRPSDVAALGIAGWNLTMSSDVPSATISGTATLGANGRFTIGGGASGAVTLKLDLTTGLIQGTARVGSGVAKPVSGVLLPSQRQGRGILWLSDRTGWLTLDPP